MSHVTYFEDFTVDQIIKFSPRTISEKEIIEFAQEFDPVPFHTDVQAAKKTFLGQLSASGWHTGSILMRMINDNLFPNGGSLGSPGVERLKWLAPVHPGDELSAECKILNTRQSRSNPKIGFVNFRFKMFKQTGRPVLQMENAIIFGVRAQSEFSAGPDA